nr:P-selectin glycoprotein ligand 1 [Anolis sagrei ordinatus]
MQALPEHRPPFCFCALSNACDPDTAFLEVLQPGGMALLWFSLLMLLSSITIAQLPIQDGFPMNFWDSPQKRWEWKSSDDGSLQDSLLFRRKRESGPELHNSSKAMEGFPKKDLGEIPKMPDRVTTPKKPMQGLITVSLTVTQSPASSVAKEAKLPKDGTHLVSKMGPATSSERLPPAKGVLATTEHWPWLHDDSSSAPAEMLGMESSTAALKPGTLKTFLKAKGRPAPFLTTTIDGLWEDQSTAPAQTTEIRKPARPRSKYRPSPYHRTTVPVKVLMDDTDTSAITGRPSLGPVGTSFGTKGKESHVPHVTTVSPVPASSTSMVGKCLLAISLLALVAGVFIVMAAVMAGLLWRQRQAYRLNRHNQTEMVCISSLLAAEEAEEGRAKGPRVQRVRMLQENGTEAEADSLTLNSFLPDH